MRFLLFFISLLTMPQAGSSAGQADPGASAVFIIPFSHPDLCRGRTEEERLSRGNRIITKAIQLSESDRNVR